MKILFVAYGGGHVAMLAPVCKHLLASGHQVHFLALTTAPQYLENEGLTGFGFKDIPGSLLPEVQSIGEKLTNDLPNGGLVSREESIAYMGRSFLDLVDQYSEAEAERLFEKKGRQAFLPVRTMKQVIDWLAPDVVVATNSPRAEQAAILAAAEIGIPSVCVVDMFALQEIQWIGKAGYASRVCVLSQAVREMFINYGRAQNEVIVTGNPAFDRLKSESLPERATDLRRLKGWKNAPVIVYASQVEPELHPFNGTKGDPLLPERYEKELYRIARDHADWRVVIRPHPSENRLGWSSLPDHVYYSDSREQLDVLLTAADLVITLTSTVGLEASLLGTPVISIQGSIFTPDAPYAEMGLAYPVNTLDELEPAIESVFTGNWVSTAAMPELGQATFNVSNVILSLNS